jgi:tripartite-type tricarboxylate transporter receptor subunit TctC
MCSDQRPEHRSTRFRAVLLGLCIVLGGLLAPDSGHAQYPSRPIKLIVSSAPGSGPDTIARVLGERLSPLLGQPIVVENRAGSNGNIAMDLVAKSAPTAGVVICADSMIVSTSPVREDALDTLKDLVPIATVASNTSSVVHPRCR